MEFRVFAGYMADESAAFVYAETEEAAIIAARAIAKSSECGEAEIECHNGRGWEIYAVAFRNKVTLWETGEPIIA